MEEQLLQEKYDALLIKYGQLKYELDNLKRMVFGRKTERFIPKPENATQLNMFADNAEECYRRGLHLCAQSVANTDDDF
jgi:regulator of replication initiation timing